MFAEFVLKVINQRESPILLPKHGRTIRNFEFFLMEEKLAFEGFLYGDESEIIINDIEFCVDRIVMLPKIRPHQLEKAVKLSAEYCQRAEFRRKLLEWSDMSPVLVYKLFKRGVFVFGEIEPLLEKRDSFLLCYYFRKEINDFEEFIKTKRKPYCFDQSFFENEFDMDQMIEYGFIPSSIEYCLKYDIIDELIDFTFINREAKWSPFEWSIKPEYLDLLSFSGFFGSIKCFKHLLMNGFEINDKTLQMVVCSGCLDLFHMSQGKRNLTIDCACKASEYFHLSLLVFMIENGADLNETDQIFIESFLGILLFILLLKRGIFLL